MVLKRILIAILIMCVLGVVTLVVTDPNIVGDLFGKSDSQVKQQHFFEGSTGFDYDYFKHFSTKSEAGEFEALLVQSWKAIDDEIDVSSFEIPRNDFENLYHSVLNNNPLYYYVDPSVEYMVSDGYVHTINPSYSETDKNVIHSVTDKIKNETNLILDSISDDMTDFEKAMAVHDYMVLNYKYDESLSNHSITIMYTKTGVCESYARAFKHLMNELDIGCEIVESDEMVHSWNLVNIDGLWYHIDLTMDDPIEDRFGQVSHEYAFLSTNAIENAQKSHYGFDLGDKNADSTIYDDAPWRGSLSSVVYLNGKTYWTYNNSVYSSEGTQIYSELDGNDGMWNISERTGYRDVCLAGLGVSDGKLYFNTDEAIMSYNLQNKKIQVVKNKSGVCGLFVNNGVLYYGESTGDGDFSYSGQFDV